MKSRTAVISIVLLLNVEPIIKQERLARLKYDWNDDDGIVHTDWDKPFRYGGFPFHPLFPGWIPLFQGAVLLAGLFFGIQRGHRAILPFTGTAQLAARLMVLPSLFALVAINILLWLYMG